MSKSEGKALKKSAAGVPFETGIFYGWIMVVIGGMGMFFSGPGQTYSNSVFVESYISNLAWSAQPSPPYTLQPH